jgi:putative transposase
VIFVRKLRYRTKVGFISLFTIWQGRFGCVAVDGEHARSALRFVLFIPVRAKICAKPEQWDWPSADAYLKGRDDGLTDTKDLLTVRLM